MTESDWSGVIGFVAVTFGLAWGWSLGLLVAGETVVRGHGWPTHFPALFAPAIAAFAVTAWTTGRVGIGDLARRVVRWRIGPRWWLAALSPILFLFVGLAVAAMAGEHPSAHQFALYSGWPALGVLGACLGALLNGLGEETGWRGYLLPQLVRRLGVERATLAIAAAWALWHLPLFFLIASYQDIQPFAIVGFLIGIASGSVVATWLYYGSGQSVLAVAVWHAAYNMAASTAASTGTVAAVASALIIAQAVVLLRGRTLGRVVPT